jgi:cellulose synthase/poly-beta-1,6-N-acetylglucosamine synthase-like glycosyltransferase
MLKILICIPYYLIWIEIFELHNLFQILLTSLIELELLLSVNSLSKKHKSYPKPVTVSNHTTLIMKNSWLSLIKYVVVQYLSH